MTSQPDTATPGAHTWNIDDLPALQFDPLLAKLLAEEPVARIRLPYFSDHEAWLVTRYEDVKLVTSDPRFSREELVDRTVTSMLSEPVASKLALGYADPPYHTKLRKVINKAFTGRHMKRLRPMAEQTAGELLDAVERHGPPADLMELLHKPFPLAVIGDLLGVPREDRARVAPWTDTILSATADPAASRAARAEVRAYIVELLRSRSGAKGEESEDLAGVLAQACDEGEITEDVAVSLATIIMVSAAHAVRYNSANMVYMLLTHPEHLARLRARPELLPQAVDELLRHIPHRNGVGLARIATEDVEVGGVLIRQGEAVYASYLTANRDPEVFENPEVLDFDREALSHLSFGHGPHHCMGAMMARMESEVMLSGLLTRFPGLRLAEPPEKTVFQSSGTIRGPQSLLVTW